MLAIVSMESCRRSSASWPQIETAIHTLGAAGAAAQAAMRGTVGGSPVKKMAFPDRRTANILLTILLLFAVVFALFSTPLDASS